MKRLLRIARTEVLEQSRQPWMLFILVASYLLELALFGAGFVMFDGLAKDPAQLQQAKQQMAQLGFVFDGALRTVVQSYAVITFTNLPLYVAIMSGTSVLRDRESGTMPFLMLAPVTRLQLLLGKLAGAMLIPLVLHLVFVGVGSLVLGRLTVLAPFSQQLGGALPWWVAFLFGGPASAAFVGALGTVISALSRDVRTAMQFTSFFIGLLSLGIGYMLVEGLALGAVVQMAFAMGCVIAASITLSIGARLISKDVTS